MATAAWDKHVGSWSSTGRPKEKGADWTTPTPRSGGFRGFASPGNGEHGGTRHMRDLSVPVQQEVIARGQKRRADEKSATQKARFLFKPGEATSMEDFDPDTNGLFMNRTRSTNPERPRTVGAGYDSRSQTVRIRFRPQPEYPGGAIYEYYEVPKNVWRNFQRSPSPGRYIDRVLDAYPYTRVDNKGNAGMIFSTNRDAATKLTGNTSQDYFPTRESRSAIPNFWR